VLELDQIRNARCSPAWVSVVRQRLSKGHGSIPKTPGEQGDKHHLRQWRRIENTRRMNEQCALSTIRIPSVPRAAVALRERPDMADRRGLSGLRVALP